MEECLRATVLLSDPAIILLMLRCPDLCIFFAPNLFSPALAISYCSPHGKLGPTAVAKENLFIFAIAAMHCICPYIKCSLLQATHMFGVQECTGDSIPVDLILRCLNSESGTRTDATHVRRRSK